MIIPKFVIKMGYKIELKFQKNIKKITYHILYVKKKMNIFMKNISVNIIILLITKTI